MLNLISKSLINSILAVLFGFIFSVIVARVLGAEARGTLGVILFICSVISSISQFGFSAGYIYSSRKFEKSSLVLILNNILIIVFTSFIISSVGTSKVLGLELKLFTEYIIITSFFVSIHTYLLQSSQLDDTLTHYNLAKFIYPVLNLIGMLLLWYFIQNINISHILFLNLISIFVSSVILYKGLYYIEKARKVKEKLLLGDIFVYSINIYSTNLTGVFLNSIDKFILMKIATFTEIGIYLVAFSTSRLFGILPETISTIIFSKYAGKSKVDASVIISNIFSCLLCPLLILGVFVYGLGYFFIPIIFGSEYYDAIHPFGILVFECVISSTGWILAQRFNVSGKPGLVLLRQIISILPLFLISIFPIDGSVVIYISLILLSCSLLRLLITIIQYKFVLNEPIPSFIPHKRHYLYIWSVIKRQ